MGTKCTNSEMLLWHFPSFFQHITLNTFTDLTPFFSNISCEHQNTDHWKNSASFCFWTSIYIQIFDENWAIFDRENSGLNASAGLLLVSVHSLILCNSIQWKKPLTWRTVSQNGKEHQTLIKNTESIWVLSVSLNSYFMRHYKKHFKNLPACKTTFISYILNNKETSLCYSWWFWAQTTEPSRFQLENKPCPLPWAPAVMHSQPQWNCSALSSRRQLCVYGCETIPGFAGQLGFSFSSLKGRKKYSKLWYIFLYQNLESLLTLLSLNMSNETITDIGI